MFPNAALSTASSIVSQAVRCHIPKLRSVLSANFSRPLSMSNDDEETISANYQDVPNKEPYRPPPPEPFVSVWGEKPPCCPEECEIYRHDLIFLKSQPKRYTRTWVEPEPLIAKKKVCGPVLEPDVEIRPRRAQVTYTGPKTCVGDESRIGLMECKKKPKTKDPCSKIRFSNCRQVREPPKCVVTKIHECCQKRCTLYPSYSECNMKKAPVKPPTECTCMKIPSNCEIFAAFRKFTVK